MSRPSSSSVSVAMSANTSSALTSEGASSSSASTQQQIGANAGSASSSTNSSSSDLTARSASATGALNPKLVVQIPPPPPQDPPGNGEDSDLTAEGANTNDGYPMSVESFDSWDDGDYDDDEMSVAGSDWGDYDDDDDVQENETIDEFDRQPIGDEIVDITERFQDFGNSLITDTEDEQQKIAGELNRYINRLVKKFRQAEEDREQIEGAYGTSTDQEDRKVLMAAKLHKGFLTQLKEPIDVLIRKITENNKAKKYQRFFKNLQELSKNLDQLIELRPDHYETIDCTPSNNQGARLTCDEALKVIIAEYLNTLVGDFHQDIRVPDKHRTQRNRQLIDICQKIIKDNIDAAEEHVRQHNLVQPMSRSQATTQQQHKQAELHRIASEAESEKSPADLGNQLKALGLFADKIKQNKQTSAIDLNFMGNFAIKILEFKIDLLKIQRSLDANQRESFKRIGDSFYEAVHKIDNRFSEEDQNKYQSIVEARLLIHGGADIDALKEKMTDLKNIIQNSPRISRPSSPSSSRPTSPQGYNRARRLLSRVERNLRGAVAAVTSARRRRGASPSLASTAGGARRGSHNALSSNNAPSHPIVPFLGGHTNDELFGESSSEGQEVDQNLALASFAPGGANADWAARASRQDDDAMSVTSSGEEISAFSNNNWNWGDNNTSVARSHNRGEEIGRINSQQGTEVGDTSQSLASTAVVDERRDARTSSASGRSSLTTSTSGGAKRDSENASSHKDEDISTFVQPGLGAYSSRNTNGVTDPNDVRHPAGLGFNLQTSQDSASSRSSQDELDVAQDELDVGPEEFSTLLEGASKLPALQEQNAQNAQDLRRAVEEVDFLPVSQNQSPDPQIQGEDSERLECQNPKFLQSPNNEREENKVRVPDLFDYELEELEERKRLEERRDRREPNNRRRFVAKQLELDDGNIGIESSRIENLYQFDQILIRLDSIDLESISKNDISNFSLMLKTQGPKLMQPKRLTFLKNIIDEKIRIHKQKQRLGDESNGNEVNKYFVLLLTELSEELSTFENLLQSFIDSDCRYSDEVSEDKIAIHLNHEILDKVITLKSMYDKSKTPEGIEGLKLLSRFYLKDDLESELEASNKKAKTSKKAKSSTKAIKGQLDNIVTNLERLADEKNEKLLAELLKLQEFLQKNEESKKSKKVKINDSRLNAVFNKIGVREQNANREDKIVKSINTVRASIIDSILKNITDITSEQEVSQEILLHKFTSELIKLKSVLQGADLTEHEIRNIKTRLLPSVDSLTEIVGSENVIIKNLSEILSNVDARAQQSDFVAELIKETQKLFPSSTTEERLQNSASSAGEDVVSDDSEDEIEAEAEAEAENEITINLFNDINQVNRLYSKYLTLEKHEIKQDIQSLKAGLEAKLKEEKQSSKGRRSLISRFRGKAVTESEEAKNLKESLAELKNIEENGLNRTNVRETLKELKDRHDLEISNTKVPNRGGLSSDNDNDEYNQRLEELVNNIEAHNTGNKEQKETYFKESSAKWIANVVNNFDSKIINGSDSEPKAYNSNRDGLVKLSIGIANALLNYSLITAQAHQELESDNLIEIIENLKSENLKKYQKDLSEEISNIVLRSISHQLAMVKKDKNYEKNISRREEVATLGNSDLEDDRTNHNGPNSLLGQDESYADDDAISHNSDQGSSESIYAPKNLTYSEFKENELKYREATEEARHSNSSSPRREGGRSEDRRGSSQSLGGADGRSERGRGRVRADSTRRAVSADGRGREGERSADGADSIRRAVSEDGRERARSADNAEHSRSPSPSVGKARMARSLSLTREQGGGRGSSSSTLIP